jgi:hypothetical protein
VITVGRTLPYGNRLLGGQPRCRTAMCIDRRRDSLEVVRVDAMPDAAQVVKVKPGWYFALRAAVEDSVR